MENKEYIGKFFASNKIKDIADSNKKTFFGDGYVNLILDNGKTECLPKKVVEIVITDEKSDLTQTQNKLFGVIVPQVLSILADYDLTMLNVQALMNKLDMSLRENYKQAVAKSFGVEDELRITLMQLQSVLTADRIKI
jgi:hypothetical protein